MNNTRYLYLVIIAVLLISVYVIGNTSSGKKILEGLENQDTSSTSNTKNDPANSSGNKLIDYSSQISKNNNYMNDTLLISKYKKEFTDFIIKLDEYSKNLMVYKLFSVVDKSKNSPIDGSMYNVIYEMEQVNRIKSFIDSLNVSMKYIDRKKN